MNIHHFTLSFFLLITIPCIIFAQDSPSRPNIVFILADDLGIVDIGAYGQLHIRTPNIDQLAEKGILFHNFYAGTSVCAPSRSSLMTGQHTGHTYIRGNKEIQPEGQEPLSESVETVAMLLQCAGYVTGAFGKWGLGMVGSSGDPNRKGFLTFFGYNCQRQSHRYYPTHLWHNDKKIILEGNDLTQKVHYAPELIQEQALDFIETNKDKPFFLFVPTVLPHAELAVPDDDFYQAYAHTFEETAHKGNDYGTQATVAGYSSVEKPRATHAAMVSRIDNHVGQIVQKIEALGLSENTIIIFSSDNGPHREGGADPAFFQSALHYRGYKRDLYEGGIRVPFIVNWPNTIAPGEQQHVAAFWDVMPTLAELTATAITSPTDGISFLPSLLGNGSQAEHPYLYWEFHEDGGRQALRSGDWKLLRLQAKQKEKSVLELYDLDKDPSEQHNIADKHPEVVKQLSALMDEAHVESPIFPFRN